ncbi:hypothetical protein [Aquimarina sp. AU119]|uniref:hypothetical protein n=1 Tax=Aquimarina sp. AU119 TaxID=2108528 RepID=UPI000D69B548|nr:hypothetical protein [Aquimarina sp. AU119]
MDNNKWLEWIRDRYLLLLVIVVYIIIGFTPLIGKLSFVPDWLKIYRLNPQDYFGMIIGAIASILGILMAVILLTVEFSNQKLTQNLNPLDNELIKNSFYNSINIIGLSFLAYLQVDKFDTDSNITIGYFLGILFLVYVYYVYPVIKRLVGKTNRSNEHDQLIDKLDLNAFQNISRYRFLDGVAVDGTLQDMKNEIDHHILNNQVLAYDRINHQILAKAFEIFDDGTNRNSCDIVCNALCWLWRENSKTAIRVNDFSYFEMVWRLVSDSYVYFSDKRAPLLHLQEIDMFLNLDFIKMHRNNNISLPLSSAIDFIETAFKTNILNNCPKQNSLTHLNRMYDKNESIEHSVDDELQWSALVDIIYVIGKIQKSAIELDDKDLFEKCARSIESNCADLFYFDNSLGNRQKGYITYRLLTSSFYNSSLALEQGLYEDTLDCFYIPERLIVNLIENNDFDIRDVKVILINLGHYLIQANTMKKLHVDTGFGTLNDFCMIGIHCVKNYRNNKKARKTVKYVIKVLKYLKEDIEKSSVNENAKVYLKTKSKFEHFVRVAIDYDGFSKEDKLVKNWIKILNTYQDVSREEDYRLVKWPK